MKINRLIFFSLLITTLSHQTFVKAQVYKFGGPDRNGVYLEHGYFMAI